MSGVESPEILFPHDPTRGVQTAVRRILIQESILELKRRNLFERYRERIDADALAELGNLIGPGWIVLELALAHYEACDSLELQDEQVHEIGLNAGAKVPDALLVAGTKLTPGPGEESPWHMVPAFWRMGRRLNQGASVQYARLGPKKLLVETIGNPLLGCHYYRVAYAGFMQGAISRLGVTVTEVRTSRYRPNEHAMDVRISWR